MNLATRFWLSGALLPLGAMALVLFGADRLFHQSLENALDRALLAQAAIESVSLFDGPEQRPHLHMASSPLVESVRAFAPEGVLFGPDGAEVMRYPPRVAPRPKERMLPSASQTEPVLRSVDVEGMPFRELSVMVRAPSGDAYALRLSAAMLQVESAVGTFHRLALLSVFVTALVVISVQTLQGRSLGRRLLALRRHVAALRAGDLTQVLPPEPATDELSALRGVLAEATHALSVARDARERLVADAAHELRTPLTLMRTRLDLALRRERSGEELKAALRDTREEVDRLALLAARLLEMAALGHADAEAMRVDLASLVQRALSEVAFEAEERVLALHYEGPAQAWLLGRPEALARLLTNLLANALRFAESQVRVALASSEGELTLSVSDDGPGIPEAEREAVFEPFHRVRGTGAGTGLGLAIVRDVARLHGGRAYVRAGTSGATVVVTLQTSTEPFAAQTG
jgi:signal transduction histidine kinase